MSLVADATAALHRAWAEHVLPTYRAPGLAFREGRGSRLYDHDGRAYLDFLSGLAVTSLGHAHPAVTAAVAQQAGRLTHTSNLFLTEPAVRLAQRLAELLGWSDGRTFFCNSGAEANEAALKLARRHGLQRSPDKLRIVALEGSFHGRTFATLEATGQSAKHAPFEPLLGVVDHVPHDDAAALADAVGATTAAVLVEAVQGEGGVRLVPDEVLVAARAACDRWDALLIVDEVQTGIGRTGDWFAWQATPVSPDVVTLAKALANGLPIGACVARGHAAAVFAPGDHASTFGGNPVSCAAALAVLDTIASDGLIDAARARGAQLSAGLGKLVGAAPYAASVRGRGLLLALGLDAPVAAELEAACRERSLLANAVTPDALRFAPPLTVTAGEVDEALATVGEALTAVAATSGGEGAT